MLFTLIQVLSITTVRSDTEAVVIVSKALETRAMCLVVVGAVASLPPTPTQVVVTGVALLHL